MKTIEIDNELILVEVSKDAVNFELGNNLLYGSTLFFKINNAKYSGTDVIKGNFEIIGLIETPNVDFDFEVEDSWVESSHHYFGMFKNYIIESTNSHRRSQCFDKKQSFRTRIQRKIQDTGLYLVNPMSNPFTTKQIGENYQKHTYIAEWQFKEGLTIKGNLLLIKKLK